LKLPITKSIAVGVVTDESWHWHSIGGASCRRHAVVLWCYEFNHSQSLSRFISVSDRNIPTDEVAESASYTVVSKCMNNNNNNCEDWPRGLRNYALQLAEI